MDNQQVDLIAVPVLEGFDPTKVVGDLRVRADALPPSAGFVFSLAIEATEKDAGAPGSIPTRPYQGAYRLVGVSAVSDESYLSYLRQIEVAPPEEDNREAWLAVITDLTAEVQALREENASQRAALEARAEDTARLVWLEEQTRLSPSGVSFDYVRFVEEGYVTECGYRFMRRHHLGSRKDALRDAIDAAMSETST